MIMEDNKNLKAIFASKNLDYNKLQNLIELIREYMDVFVWNYKDMSRLNTKIAQHHLNIKPDARLMKQQEQKFKPEMQEAIEIEVKELKACGSIREEQHLDSLAMLY